MANQKGSRKKRTINSKIHSCTTNENVESDISASTASHTIDGDGELNPTFTINKGILDLFNALFCTTFNVTDVSEKLSASSVNSYFLRFKSQLLEEFKRNMIHVCNQLHNLREHYERGKTIFEQKISELESS